MTAWTVAPLEGRLVRLDPLRRDDVGELLRAATEDRSTYGYTVVPDSREAMEVHVRKLLDDHDAGSVVAFVQVDARTSRVAGMTRYLNIRTSPLRRFPFAVEIGGTWLSATAQRSGLNTEAKFLLLRHAFEVWGVARVDIKTDHRNLRARSSIERLGATFEGVLRHWQPSQVAGEEGSFRDTAMYSVTDEEWDRCAQRLGTLIR